MKSNARFAAGFHLDLPFKAPHGHQSSAHSASLHPRFPPRVPFGHAPPTLLKSQGTSTRRSLQRSPGHGQKSCPPSLLAPRGRTPPVTLTTTESAKQPPSSPLPGESKSRFPYNSSRLPQPSPHTTETRSKVQKHPQKIWPKTAFSENTAIMP